MLRATYALVVMGQESPCTCPGRRGSIRLSKNWISAFRRRMTRLQPEISRCRGLSCYCRPSRNTWMRPFSEADYRRRARPRAPARQASRTATAAPGPKISKTTPCKVAWRSLACAIPRRHLTRRANHLQYSIIAQSAKRKPTWHQRRGARTTRLLPPQHHRSYCTPRTAHACDLVLQSQGIRRRRVHRIPPDVS